MTEEEFLKEIVSDEKSSCPKEEFDRKSLFVIFYKKRQDLLKTNDPLSIRSLGAIMAEMYQLGILENTEDPERVLVCKGWEPLFSIVADRNTPTLQLKSKVESAMNENFTIGDLDIGASAP